MYRYIAMKEKKGSKQPSKEQQKIMVTSAIKRDIGFFTLEINCIFNNQPRSRGRVGTRQFSKL